MNNTPYTNFELVTVDRARDLLHMNKNRKLSESYAKELADKMIRGKFLTTHQGIAIDWDGYLRDGQHRARGIVLSGCPQTMAVTYNVDPDAYDVMDDRVRSRSMADRLSVGEHEVGPHEVAALKVIYRTGSGVSGKTLITKEDLDPYMPTFGKMAHDLLVGFCKTNKKLLTCAPVRAAAVICAVDRDKDYAFNAYRRLISGDANNMEIAERALFSWLARQKTVHGDQWREPVLTRAVLAFDPRWSRVDGMNFKKLEDRVSAIATRIRSVIERNNNG